MLRVAVLLVFVSGCFYSQGSLDPHYKNYPHSVEEEQARRSTRRRHALIASPIEIVAGLGVTALALYAPVTHAADADESITDALGDGAKEIAGRALLAGAGGAMVMGGVGDLVLGATDPTFASPLVRDGALVPADRIDAIEPASGPRLDPHVSETLSTRTGGGDLGVGLTHWLSPVVRVREAASLEWGFDWRGGDHDRRIGASADVTVERAFGRALAGLYPRHSFGAYVGGGAAWGDAAPHGLVRAGLETTSRITQLRLGVTYETGGHAPTIELAVRRELAVD